MNSIQNCEKKHASLLFCAIETLGNSDSQAWWFLIHQAPPTNLPHHEPTPLGAPRLDSQLGGTSSASWWAESWHLQKLVVPGNFGDSYWKEASLVGGWTNPFEKLCSSTWIVSPNRDENRKYLKRPPRSFLGLLLVVVPHPFEKVCQIWIPFPQESGWKSNLGNHHLVLSNCPAASNHQDVSSSQTHLKKPLEMAPPVAKPCSHWGHPNWASNFHPPKPLPSRWAFENSFTKNWLTTNSGPNRKKNWPDKKHRRSVWRLPGGTPWKASSSNSKVSTSKSDTF